MERMRQMCEKDADGEDAEEDSQEDAEEDTAPSGLPSIRPSGRKCLKINKPSEEDKESALTHFVFS